MHSQESGPRGVETRPPSFFPGICSGGYLFSSGGPTPTTLPPIFTLVAANCSHHMPFYRYPLQDTYLQHLREK